MGGGEEARVLDTVHCDGGWAVREKQIYFFAIPDKRGHSEIRCFEFATGQTSKTQTIEQGIGPFITVSPDGRTILYIQLDEVGSDLMLVENFK